MAKKCIPGLICVENMTLFLCMILVLVVAFLWYRVNALGNERSTPRLESSLPIQDIRNDVGRCSSCRPGTIGDPLTNPYIPPVKCDAGSLSTLPLRVPMLNDELPINIPTQSYHTQYTQIGILTKEVGNRQEILPLMGRRTITSRNKWQYYTIAGGGNGGNLQAKLPIKNKGKKCSSEYGCDEINDGDEIYIEGYHETFRATIYESGLFSYIPY